MKTADMLRMANQIAANLQVTEADAVGAVAAHIKDFWDPRMRAALRDHVAGGGEGLHPLVLEAAETLFQKSVA